MSVNVSAPAYPAGESSHLVPPVTCFSLVAAADPGVLPRVIQVFAKRGLVPCQVFATIAGPDGCDLHVDLQVAGLDGLQRHTIAASLRQIVSVDTVLTALRTRARSA